jgi:hypothetical protein
MEKIQERSRWLRDIVFSMEGIAGPTIEISRAAINTPRKSSTSICLLDFELMKRSLLFRMFLQIYNKSGKTDKNGYAGNSISKKR